jgi:hypothetical protein
MDWLLFARGNLHGIGSRRYVSGLFGQHAGCGLDGNTHAPLVSLADRFTGTIWVIRLWVRCLVRSMQSSQSRTGGK